MLKGFIVFYFDQPQRGIVFNQSQYAKLLRTKSLYNYVWVFLKIQYSDKQQKNIVTIV